MFREQASWRRVRAQGPMTIAIPAHEHWREAFGDCRDHSPRARFRHYVFPRHSMSNSESRLELILKVDSDAERDIVMERLRQLGFDPLAMKVGVLLGGDIASLRRLIPTLTGTAIGSLPVPTDLAPAVRSIHVFGPRSLHL